MNFWLKLIHKTVTKVVFFIFIIMLLLSFFFFWGWYEKQVNKCIGFYLIYKGDKAQRGGNLEKAITLYKQGLEKYPEHSLARCNLGNIYVKYEDYISAVDEYSKALEYDPKFIVCRMNLGIVSAEKLADYDTAIREYQTILETNRFTFHIPLVYNSVQPTKDNKSIAWYNMGLAYRGKSLLMGEKTYASNQYLKKAVECYEKALKRTKKSFDLYYNYALANHLLGNYKDAGLAYCKAIEIEPLSFDAHYNMALLLKHLKKYREALDELEKAGMIVDTTTDIRQSGYVFNILNEVSQKMVAQEEYKHIVEQVTDETAWENSQVTYIHGKVVANDEYEKNMVKEFSKCTGKKIFEDAEE